MESLADPTQQQQQSSASAAQHAYQMNGQVVPQSAMSAPVDNAGVYDTRSSSSASGSHHMTRQQQLHLQQQLHAQQMRQQQQHPSMELMSNPYVQHPYARERTPTPPSMLVHRTPGSPGEPRAVHLLSVCESCLLVVRLPGYDMSFRRIVERKCPRCGGMLTLPQENMEMFILYGHYIPESVGATIVLGTIGLHPSLRADFVAAVMNELLIPLQTDFVYDVAVPKRQDGLGMSLRMDST